jgi:hypothetical protein
MTFHRQTRRHQKRRLVYNPAHDKATYLKAKDIRQDLELIIAA